MAKAIKCELWVGTSTRYFKWSNFESIADAKRYVKSCITCYSEIKRLVSVLKPIGEINVDCIINNELVYIIEINGRFAGGSPMSFNAGANSPLNLIKLLKNEKLDYNEEYKEGMIALRFDECIYLED